MCNHFGTALFSIAEIPRFQHQKPGTPRGRGSRKAVSHAGGEYFLMVCKRVF